MHNLEAHPGLNIFSTLPNLMDSHALHEFCRDAVINRGFQIRHSQGPR